MSSAATLFLNFSREKLLGQYWPRMRQCVESLTDEQIWWRPNEECNSIGNLMLHLSGNVQQWLVSSFEGLADTRERSTEFAERNQIPRDELLVKLDATMQGAEKVLTRLTEEDLVQPMKIQGYKVTGLDAVYQVVEHFGMHYGQVLYITKQVRGEGLGFYKHLDKTGLAS